MATPAKKPFYGRAKVPRTRSGCLQCRQRRVKCDEQKPTCKRCRDGCWPCRYGLELTWPEEKRQGKPRSPCSSIKTTSSLRQKRKCPQRGTIGHSTTPCSSLELVISCYPRWFPFVNATYDDMEFFYHPTAPSAARARSKTHVILPSATALPCAIPSDHIYFHSRPHMLQRSIGYPYVAHRMTLLDQHLFDFYINGMCPRCILLDNKSESYRKVLIPIALQSKSVTSSILALASRQMSVRVSDCQYQETALKYHGSSLALLSQALVRLTDTSSPGYNLSKTEVLGTILMLCLYDMMDNNFQTETPFGRYDWVVHSLGAESLLAAWGVHEGGQPCDKDITAFLGHLLGARFCLLQSTLPTGYNGEETFMSTSFWLSNSNRPYQEVNCFSGCSNELLAIISETISLVRQYHQARRSPNRFTLVDDGSKTIIEQKLLSLHQELPSYTKTIPGSLSTTVTSLAKPTLTHQRLSYISEAYRYAAIIMTEYLNDGGEPPDDSEVVREAVSKILTESSLRTALYIPSPGNAGRSSLLWPYFIAACHVTRDDELRHRTMAEFAAAVSRDPPSADVLDPMLDIIQDVWKQRDLHADEEHGSHTSFGRDDANGYWGFLWESVLKYRGWQLSWA